MVSLTSQRNRVVCVLVSLPRAITTLRALSRAHTPVDPMKPTAALVTEGPFRYSRNPIYLALTLLYLGVVFFVNALWILLLVVPALVMLGYGVIAREEAYLARKFGEAYPSIRPGCDVGSNHDFRMLSVKRGLRL